MALCPGLVTAGLDLVRREASWEDVDPLVDSNRLMNCQMTSVDVEPASRLGPARQPIGSRLATQFQEMGEFLGANFEPAFGIG